MKSAPKAVHTTDSRLSAKTNVCDHCVSAERVRAARAAPLRMLTAAALNPYAWNGLYTWGDVEEFKHYLPRLLELLILEELDDLHAPSLMLRLGVRWQTWMQDQAGSRHWHRRRMWRQTLSSYPRDVDGAWI
ncbi:hypothetical protein [Microbispora hainanensis]|uniref:Uncharacterized protein n=1 Tax=Microbispora hainanensis TaxID=568844 RepID=A0A544Y197_9ACTN|nr:hypothetical protein [Microbispora hainanensis]TQS10539.1 hypothetical protein FLX08_38205 [Microbispora hainanensis]